MRLIIYLSLVGIATMTSVLVADIYFGYPFPFGILIGLTISAVISLFHLLILKIKSLLSPKTRARTQNY